MTQNALRESMISESRDATPQKKVRRLARLRAPETTRVSRDEIASIARGVVLPGGVTDLCMAVDHTPGGTLPNGTPNGLGGHTQYGPAWVLEGRLQSAPVHLFDAQEDARELFRMLAGEEGELWQRKQRRRDAIAAAEALEAASAAEAATASASQAKTKRRALRRGDGDGWSPPSSSSEKRTASSGRGTSRRDRLRRASGTTS